MNNLFATEQTIKRSTPDYSSSSLATPKDRLVAKRQGNNHAGDESKAVELERRMGSCQDLIDGLNAVLTSARKSFMEVGKEVKARNPDQPDPKKLTDIKNRLAQITEYLNTEMATNDMTRESMHTFIKTVTDFIKKLGDYRYALGETESTWYEDLKLYAGNIRSFAVDFEKSCTPSA